MGSLGCVRRGAGAGAGWVRRGCGAGALARGWGATRGWVLLACTLAHFAINATEIGVRGVAWLAEHPQMIVQASNDVVHKDLFS